MSHHLVHLFVDGGCRSNGTPNAHMYWSMGIKSDDKLIPCFTVDNEVVDNPHMWGEAALPYVPNKSTNNVAELLAIIYALKYIWELHERIENISELAIFTICTDSEYALGACTTNKVKANHDLVKGMRRMLSDLKVSGIRVDIVKAERSTIVDVLGH